MNLTTHVSGTVHPAGSLFDPSKGSLGNRIECTGSHVCNNVKTNLKVYGTLGGAAGLTWLAKKYPKFAETLNLPVKLVKASIGKNLPKLLENKATKEIIKAGSKVLKFVKGAPLVVKIATPLIIAGIMLKHAFNSGRIEQKYEDRSKFNEAIRHNIRELSFIF